MFLEGYKHNKKFILINKKENKTILLRQVLSKAFS